MEIDMNNKFERLNPDEVISPNFRGLDLPNTFKVRELIEVVKNNMRSTSTNLFENDGLELEVLKLDAKGWKKGKVRFSLEFCPDEPDIEEILTSSQPEINQIESPLDEIRRMINEDI